MNIWGRTAAAVCIAKTTNAHFGEQFNLICCSHRELRGERTGYCGVPFLPSWSDTIEVFSKLKPEGNEIDLYFTEPVDLEGSMASFIADKPVNINRVTPTSRTKSLDLDRSNAAYLSASIDPPLEGYTQPVLIAGYLDYGEFGFGQGPKRHLTYTFNAQVRIASADPGC